MSLFDMFYTLPKFVPVLFMLPLRCFTIQGTEYSNNHGFNNNHLLSPGECGYLGIYDVIISISPLCHPQGLALSLFMEAAQVSPASMTTIRKEVGISSDVSFY